VGTLCQVFQMMIVKIDEWNENIKGMSCEWDLLYFQRGLRKH
jgi:hypothetical protein